MIEAAQKGLQRAYKSLRCMAMDRGQTTVDMDIRTPGVLVAEKVQVITQQTALIACHE